MDYEEVDGHFEVKEWKIKNFCFWNLRIHGNIIQQEYTELDLFPRGLKGNEDNLVLRVYTTESTSSVDVSFIGPDGSLLCHRQIDDPKSKDVFEMFSGPKFEEIVRARKKNPECMDILTILCRQKKDEGSWYRAETNLVVADIRLKVSGDILKDIKLGKPKLISDARYLSNNIGDHDIVALYVSLANSVLDDTKVVFYLKAENVLIHTNLSLIDSDNSTIKYQENYHLFGDVENWVFSDVLQKNEVIGNANSVIIHLKVITGDTEHLKVESVYFKKGVEVVTPPSGKTNTSFEVDNNSVAFLSKELMHLYQNQDHADFHLHCGNTTFSTHRGILSARSPVFRSMLSSGMKEAASGSMEITDLDSKTLGLFLGFLYSGTVDNLEWESALKLYYSADKYQVPSLKNKCRTVLTSSVSTSNVCRILSLAYKHQDYDLLSILHEFLSENECEVLKSEEWESFMLDEPYYASKTATSIILEKSTQNGMK